MGGRSRLSAALRESTLKSRFNFSLPGSELFGLVGTRRQICIAGTVSILLLAAIMGGLLLTSLATALITPLITSLIIIVKALALVSMVEPAVRSTVVVNAYTVP